MSAARVLIVEDDLLVATDLSDMVGSLGHEVVAVVDNGHDAVRVAGEFRPDLALMDVKLRGDLDGVSAARQITESSRLPIIFLTAYEDEWTLSRTRASSAFGFLTKPVRKNELLASISFALDKHRVIEDLLDRHTWLRTLFSSIREGVIAVDTKGLVRFLNPEGERITCWKAADAFGKAVEEVYPLSFRVGGVLQEPRIRAAGRTGKEFPRERVTLKTREGNEILIEDVVTPLSNDGRLLGAVSIFRDMRETLRLEQAQKFETVGVLAAGVAHDFNNMLAVTIGNASLAADLLKQDSQESEYLEEVVNSGKKAAALTRQLLAYAGKGPLCKTSVDISKAVGDIVELFRTTLAHNIALVTHLPGNLPAIEADSIQIEQVVMNLVINASEAIGDRQGMIHVSTGIRDGRRDGVFIQVRDNGPGMDPETRSKIFDPFFTTKFIGRGLGLAASQGIIHSHEGIIDVDTELGKGTTFTVVLPASKTAVAAIFSEPTTTIRRGSETILIVDDNESVRRFARKAMESFGYRCFVADGGEAALKLLAARNKEIDLVLLDLSMPVMSGSETWLSIRTSYPDVPICVMSGYSEEIARPQFQKSGIDSVFLQKPFTSSQLAAKIQIVLDPD